LSGNAWTKACQIEAQGQEILLPWLRHRYDNIVVNSGGRLQIELQKIADMFANKDDKVVALEIKVEYENLHDNLFLESWSNKSRYNPGWLVKSEADLLIYYFLKEDDAFVFGLQKLKKWAFESKLGKWQVANYPEKMQGKYQQLNDTWGWCVPIDVCMKAAGKDKYHPKREMEEIAEHSDATR